MGLMFKTLAKQQLRYRGFLCFFLSLSLVAAIASVVITRLTGDMGQAALELDTGVLMQLFGLFTGIMVIRAIASASSALVIGRFAGRAGYSFRDNFVKYFLQKPFSSFEGVKSGESLSVLSNDLPASVELVSNGGVRMIADVLSLVVSVVYMIYINWWLSLIFFALFPVLVIMQVLISNPIQRKSALRLEARAAVSAIAADTFQNTGVVVAYSLEKVMTKRYHSAFNEWIIASKSMARSYLSLILAGIIASVAPLITIIAVSAHQVIAGNMNIAEWIVFMALASEAGNWLMMLSQRQNNVKTNAAGAQRMDEHMSGESEDVNSGVALSYSGSIAVLAENVTFSYSLPDEQAEDKTQTATTESENKTQAETTQAEDTTKPVTSFALDKISFEIKQGSRVVFVGGSGSGKSTVLKLLLGLYAPQEGKLSVMGQSVADVSLKSLRETYSYVPQDSFLFPESVLGNITGESTITDMPRLRKACSDAGILEFIESLPEGFDAVLGESAENVSGGQKQRIALARAFYKDAPIILFDEATSALDPATEAEVLQGFKTLALDKTVIMVAHRLRAIDFCDTIVVMNEGKIESIGTHDQLIKTSQTYKNLYETI